MNKNPDLTFKNETQEAPWMTPRAAQLIEDAGV
jgi:hypothetical protein